MSVAVLMPAQMFEPLDAATEAALRESIKRFGVLVPVAKDQHGNVLDGLHRSRLADALGVEYRVDVHVVADEVEAREIARTLNTDRRHLTPAQRRAVVATLRKDGHSLRAIAGAVGASKSQIERDLSTVPPGTVDRVTGLDGRVRPARQPPREKGKAASRATDGVVLTGAQVEALRAALTRGRCPNCLIAADILGLSAGSSARPRSKAEPRENPRLRPRGCTAHAPRGTKCKLCGEVHK